MDTAVMPLTGTVVIFPHLTLQQVLRAWEDKPGKVLL